MLAPADASVVDVASWTPIFQGIDSTSATIGGSTGYAVRIDLDAPGIAFTTTPKSGPLDTTAQTTSQFLQSSGTQVAINAGFFDPCCNARPEAKNIEGLAISNGSLVSVDEAGRPVLLLTQGNQATITSSAAGPLDLSNIYNAVSGSNIILSNGLNVAPTAHNSFNDANPRSAVGTSQDGEFLYLVAIDGRQPGYSDGTSLVETADLLLALGAYSGLNLDGGGSTALVEAGGANGAFDLNRPSGGTERYDGNNLGVFANALPVPEPASFGIFGLAVGMTLLRRRLFS
jgi:exopolysaccharide biosynthesis protein